MYDLIIIGAGPAGMSAAVYAARAELDFIVIEGSMMQGGQVLTTYDVDNYLGLPGIGGFEMGMKFAEHAKKLGVSFVTENVISMDAAGEVKKVVTDKKEYEAKKGLNWYDYGARHYDAALGRFTTNDRFAEKYHSMSPYQYGANNRSSKIIK